MAADELTPAAPRAANARAEVEALIPHRDPFLLIDRIVEQDVRRDAPDDASVTVEWRLDPSLPFYQGHYPGQPVTPGVMLCEHAFQGGAILVSLALGGFAADDGVPVLTRIEGAKFKRIVNPGDAVTTSVTVRERLGPAWYLRAVVRVDGAVSVRIDYVLSATAAMSRVTDAGA